MIRVDHHLHLLAIFGAGVLSGYLHGWLWGILAVVALGVVISATNLAAMSTGSLWTLRANRWGWVAAAYALLILTR